MRAPEMRCEVAETSETSPQRKGRLREFAGRLVVALGARALWALIERMVGHHFHG
ncbi:hypothetical protein P405_00435 [Streptomyces sp. FR-008]|nr:hypothetical protein P405_00435 [Streptomyces sp. FR-008]